MDYLFLYLREKEDASVEPVDVSEMFRWSGGMRQEGKLRSGAPLHPDSAATRISVRGGRVRSIDGPFAESKEVVGGYTMIEAASRDEAIELARRCPAARSGVVEVSEAFADRLEAPPSGGTRYLLLFIEPPDFGGDPDGAKYRAMTDWTDALKDEKKYVECAGLAKDPPAARIQTRRGKTATSDGPFAESKEVVGGYALVDVRDRAEALDAARRCPHAGWGEIEVREVMTVRSP